MVQMSQISQTLPRILKYEDLYDFGQEHLMTYAMEEQNEATRSSYLADLRAVKPSLQLTLSPGSCIKVSQCSTWPTKSLFPISVLVSGNDSSRSPSTNYWLTKFLRLPVLVEPLLDDGVSQDLLRARSLRYENS